MRRNYRLCFPALAVYGLLAISCDRSETGESSTGRFPVVVSIQPQTYFVNRIGGEFVDVRAILSPGQSHGAFDPSPKQMAALTVAKAYFRIGVAFEQPLLKKMAEVCPDVVVVDTREGIQLLHLDEHHGHDHAGGDAHDHSDPNHICGENQLDPHVWLDPTLVKKQAQLICDTLAKHDPNHAENYRSNLTAFLAELDVIDRELSTLLDPHRGKTILVFHPSFAYFCQRYGLEQLVIETEGKEPGPRKLGEIIATARQKNVGVVFSQEEYSSAGAQAVAEEIGARVVRVAPQSADWKDNLLSMAREMVKSFKGADVAAPSAAQPRRTEPRP
ncbi:MAG TPA: zinc ABC transporter substrate-binding protein [Phycisphaerae bacterium]|nr:zinc ABC transporter substrate-binding protein [Phycisphaerae bacterium]